MYKITKIVYNLYNGSRPEKIKIQTFCKTNDELFELINEQLVPETEIKKILTKNKKINLQVLNKLLEFKCVQTKDIINKEFEFWKQDQIIEKYTLFVE